MPPLEPAILTIFGITGDLAHRKLLPALYNLIQNEAFPEACQIVGVTRRGTTPAEVIAKVEQAVLDQGRPCDKAVLAQLEQAITIITMDITDGSAYIELRKQLDDIESKHGNCMQRLFYLAIPAQMFGPIVDLLGVSGLNTGCQHRRAESRLLIEKPLGYDLDSATTLLTQIAETFSDKQLYLIDHYLAKPAVAELLALRFQDKRFEKNWDAKHIAQITIRAEETLGIEGRAVFYEEVGALRDMVQSHLMQLLALTTMNQPKDPSALAIQAAKLQLLEAVKPLNINDIENHTVRGQYEGYRQEVANTDSVVETFAATKLTIADERWQGLSVLLSTGKKLATKRTAIEVDFKPHENQPANRLTINVEPRTDISFGPVGHQEGIVKPAAEQMDAYEKVIIDAMSGDKKFFVSPAEILASWHVITPILEGWSKNLRPLEIYAPGSKGPTLKAKHSS